MVYYSQNCLINLNNIMYHCIVEAFILFYSSMSVCKYFVIMSVEIMYCIAKITLISYFLFLVTTIAAPSFWNV